MIFSLVAIPSIVLFQLFSISGIYMGSYQQSKKTRYIVSAVYLLIMALILGGTYLSEPQKSAAEKVSQDSASH
jgi:hypothetical protein